LTLGRKFSKHRKRWGLAGSIKEDDELDELDSVILCCIAENPGINIKHVWDHITDKGLDINLLSAYYRVNTLEKASYLRTEKGNRNERKCWILDNTEKT